MLTLSIGSDTLANGVDHYQTPQNAMSDQDLYLRPIDLLQNGFVKF